MDWVILYYGCNTFHLRLNFVEDSTNSFYQPEALIILYLPLPYKLQPLEILYDPKWTKFIPQPSSNFTWSVTAHTPMISGVWISYTVSTALMCTLIIHWSFRVDKYLLLASMFSMVRLKYCSLYWPNSAYKYSRTINRWNNTSLAHFSDVSHFLKYRHQWVCFNFVGP